MWANGLAQTVGTERRVMRNLGTFIKSVLLVGLVGFLAACNSTFKSDVSSFHSLPAPQGEKVVIVPMNDELKGSLEFATYASILGSELMKFGYVPADGQEPDLIVELDYTIDDGKVFVRSYGSAFGHGFGYPYRYGYGFSRFHRFHHFHHFSRFGRYGFYGHGWSPWGYAPDVRSYVKYTKQMKVSIRPNKPDAMNLYEATVENSGRSKKLQEIVPLMVKSLFTNFPGQSGETQRVVLNLDEQNQSGTSY